MPRSAKSTNRNAAVPNRRSHRNAGNVAASGLETASTKVCPDQTRPRNRRTKVDGGDFAKGWWSGLWMLAGLRKHAEFSSRIRRDEQMKNSSREDKLIFPGIKSTHSSQLQPHSGYVASSPLKGRIVQSVPRRRRRVILRGPIWCVFVCVPSNF